ncbi:MAG: RDD family protein [Actinomycetes bacterium]
MRNGQTTRKIIVLRRATPQHRLGGYFVEAGLMVVTFFIGWIIWSLIAWASGQTPAKQVLKMRVYNEKRVAPASWGNMAVRQFLIPLGVLVVNGMIVNGLVNSGDVNGSFTVEFFYVGLVLLDVLWIFKGGARRRILDISAGTIVVNEAN